MSGPLSCAKNTSSRREGILVVEFTQHGFGANGIRFASTMSRRGFRDCLWDLWQIRNSRTQGHMRAGAIVVDEPQIQSRTQVGFIQRNHPVQTLSANSPYQALTNPIYLWTVWGRSQHFDSEGFDRCIEQLREDAVSIMNQE